MYIHISAILSRLLWFDILPQRIIISFLYYSSLKHSNLPKPLGNVFLIVTFVVGIVLLGELTCINIVFLVSCGILEHGNDDIKLDGQAFRSMVISSDGQYLAAGDFSGNLHVFNLQTSTYTCIKVHTNSSFSTF